MNIILIFEWIAFAFSLFLFHPRNDVKVRPLIAVLVITVVVEGIGYYYHRILGKANHQFYNVSVPLIIIVFLFLIQAHYHNKKHKNFLLIGMFCFITFAILNASYVQGMSRFCTYTYIAGTLLLVVGASIYYLETVQEPVHVSLKREPMFWITTSILILYLPKSILYAAFEYLAYRNELMENFGSTFHLMNKVLSVIFFCFLSFASVCRLISRN